MYYRKLTINGLPEKFRLRYTVDFDFVLTLRFGLKDNVSTAHAL